MNAATAVQENVNWRNHRGARLATCKGHDVIACEICGFSHIVPLPAPEALEREYRENYYGEEKPTYLAHAGEDQDWAKLAQTDRLEALARLLPANRRRLLDVGSGPGFFVKTAVEQGWRAEGIEPSRQAVAHARSMGLAITEGFFGAESAKKLGRFDAVHMNNMLEHVPDPVDLIVAARDLLEPGGVLCVGVPNDFSPLQSAAAASGMAQWWVAPLHHLNYFDFDSLTRVLQRLGLRVAERHTSFPMEAFLLMGEDYTADPALGRACHNRRKRFDLALEHAGLGQLRRSFYGALAGLGLGREAVVIAIKD